MSEFDPNGIDAHAPGAKLDAGKPRVAFALSQFFTAISHVNGVSEHGAEKYTRNGWREVEGGEQRYMEALLRHAAQHVDGELYDEKSGLLHVAHMAWNALAVVEFVCKQSKVNYEDILPLIQKLPEPTSDEEQNLSLYQPVPKKEKQEGGEPASIPSQEKLSGSITIKKRSDRTVKNLSQFSTMRDST